MFRLKPYAPLLGMSWLGVAALAACATPQPTGPNVLALPTAGQSLTQFQQNDLACRGYAQQQIAPAAAQSAGGSSVATGAVVGTGLGAAAGAAIGAAAGAAGTGAAVGAATGLLAGTAIGANNADVTAAGLQQRYDIGYTQCMAAHGNQVESMAVVAPYGGYPYPYGYTYAYAPYYDPWFDPFFGVGFFGGFGPRFHHGLGGHFGHFGHFGGGFSRRG